MMPSRAVARDKHDSNRRFQGNQVNGGTADDHLPLCRCEKRSEAAIHSTARNCQEMAALRWQWQQDPGSSMRHIAD